MCSLCDKIYECDEEFYTKEQDAFFIRNLFSKKRLSISCALYHYDMWAKGEDKETELLFIKYCPECGRQVSFDRNYEGTILDKEYKIIND